MAITPEHLLGAYIARANPYKLSPSDPKPKDFELMLDQVEKDKYGAKWYFRNQEYRIAGALRIPYCFTDKDGQEVMDYILIGFEGMGSG
jgi:hypothetical protein